MKSKTADEQELLASVQFTLPTAQRVLAFAPHPDDEVFGCGGMLALLGNQGCLVSVIVVTDGAAGGRSAAGDLARIRAHESRKAAGVLGLSAPTFWGLSDRGLAYGELLVERVKTAIAEAEADLVLLPSPTELHPDHQALALAGAEALRRLGGDRRALFYEINLPLPSPNLVIDITSVFEQKRAAMACFSSQLEEQPYDRRIEGLNRFRSYFLGPHAEAAEAYVILDAASIQPGLVPLFEGPLAHRRRLGFAVSGEDIPLVSIIVRSMDRPTLMEALDSVALQTWPNTEVVVVNARGGDHSPLPEHCGRFSLRLINQKNGEPLSRPRAANLALESAQGQWIVFLDDDDSFDSEHVAALIQAVQAHPGALAAYAGVRVVDTRGTVCGVFNSPYDRRRLVASNFLPMHAVLFSSLLVTKQGVRFDESFDVYEDWDFWMQVSRHTDFIHLDQVTATCHPIGDSRAGVVFDERVICRGRSRFFSKWLKRWRGDEVAEGFKHLEFERDEKSHALVRQQEEFERERAGLVQERQLSEQLLKQQFDRQLSDLETSLTAILASRSWRLTAPLRRLAAFVRVFVAAGKGTPTQ
ncbi:MAG: PIG-L family deacetylase [Deltaproteobacteria bacterium]|nr:PIG-L family deacetylase [Deltaproteobacteria bacterium]